MRPPTKLVIEWANENPWEALVVLACGAAFVSFAVWILFADWLEGTVWVPPDWAVYSVFGFVVVVGCLVGSAAWRK